MTPNDRNRASNQQGSVPPELRDADLHWDDGHDDFPPLPVAQLIVMTTEPHTATAKVIYSLREMTVGTMVELD